MTSYFDTLILSNFGKLLLCWSMGIIHRKKAIKQFLAIFLGSRHKLTGLPGPFPCKLNTPASFSPNATVISCFFFKDLLKEPWTFFPTTSG